MVTVSDQLHLLEDGSIDVEAWLTHLEATKPIDNISLVRNACILSQLAGQDHPTESGESCLQQGLAMAQMLAELGLDAPTIAAAIVYDSVQYADLNIEDVEEQLGKTVAKLVVGVDRMNTIGLVRRSGSLHNHGQLDNLRKMLLAMVDDVRIVLIKLAERLRVLRTMSSLSENLRRDIAKEITEIYAPLANRLGVGQIKWEMEDLALRNTNPEKYREIARGLKARRVERDQFVAEIIATLQQKISELGISGFEVYGRAKHINSIYKKMQRKNIDLTQIFDAIAVRVLVKDVDDCYSVLSLVHELWTPIAQEYDDYIQQPKENGYRSLHTAVTTNTDRIFEVQIRTFEMHQQAERGVAAHWRYKEGENSASESHERKIEWLREVLAWQKEVASHDASLGELENEFFDDRVYVFTPEGDVLDLPRESTPLDFAYAIHSAVGHRCRGAKVNGQITPLTYHLNTGDQIEILTGKVAKPSRDWLNPHLGYLKSSRAKARIHHWFKEQDFEEHVALGKDILERELKKLNIAQINYDDLAHACSYKKADDFFAALGRGDSKRAQFLSKLMAMLPAKEQLTAEKNIATRTREQASSGISILGVGNLLTTMARCCRALPGDPIIGYITLGRGISIHRRDCPNILNADESRKHRLLEVDWGTEQKQSYTIDLSIKAFDRYGLLQDITGVLANEKIPTERVHAQSNRNDNTVLIALTIIIDSLQSLSRLLDRLNHIPNIIHAKRVER